MYPSGAWRGFWQQDGYGRQSMEQFQMTFRDGAVTGRGIDIIGPFIIRGEYDDRGRVSLVKQYVGKHAVVYEGQPDGEGSILGTWTIDMKEWGVCHTGPFLMQPVREKHAESLPIRDL